MSTPSLVEDIFLAAVEKATPEERAAYLDEACRSDAELRRRVERLLAAHPKAGDFLAQPPAEAPLPVAPGATVDSAPGQPETEDYDEPTARVGAILADKYKLVEEIGEGGMGSVFMAQQTEPVKRAVAVKVIKAGMDSKAVLARFEAERQALAMMDHPNIAKVLDAGTTDGGRPFFVMELVRGTPITRYCDEHRLTPRQRLELFVPVCQAIQHAHQKGIIHRDIKPSNVLVAMYDDRPVPKVIDFGVAKAAGQSLTDRTLMTGFGALVGTPEYMSPEQASLNNLDIDTRSDVYSLGVLLYELLTGTTPVDKKSLGKAALLEILRIVREVEAPRPSAKLSTIDTLPSVAANRGTEPAKLSRLMKGELDWLVMKALEKDRTRRYDTANALSRDIQRYLADEVVEAQPPSVGYRVSKFLRRNKGPVAAALVVAAALIVGIAVATWQARIAIRAEKDANTQRDAADQARQAESAAHRQTQVVLTESQEKTARMTYERAQALCDSGRADLGLLWMARSLELTPPDASDLDRAIRMSLNLWAGQMTTVRPIPTAPEWQEASPILDCAVSPDGLSILTAHLDGAARLWELSTGKLRFALLLEKDAPPVDFFSLSRVAFSPDGRFVAATRGDRRARIWLAASGRPVREPLPHEDTVLGVGFDPAGKLLATAAGKRIQFWSVERGVPEGQPLVLEEAAHGPEFSSDGRHLLVWGRHQFQIWNVPARTLHRQVGGIDFRIFHACFSPDGRFILANGQQGTEGKPWGSPAAQFWEVGSGRPVGDRIQWDGGAPAGGFPRSAFRPDGRVVAIGGLLRLWQAPSGKPLGTVGPEMYSNWPVFGRDGKVLIGSTPWQTDGTDHWQLLDVAPALLPVQEVPLPGTPCHAFAIGPDGRTAVTCDCSNGTRHVFRLINLISGEVIGRPIEMEMPRATPTAIRPAFSTDGRSVATGVGKNACQIWNTATGGAHGPGLSMKAAVTALAFSPDGRLLAGGDLDGGIQLWNTMTGLPVGPPLAHKYAVSNLRFTGDGRKLLAAGGHPGSTVGEARVWEVASARPLGPPLEIHGEVHDAAFSPDGKTFVTGAFQLILWDTETCRQRWTAPVVAVTRQVAFSRQDFHLANGRLLGCRHVCRWNSSTPR
jgi:serine/threonine protein kinase/WD40 repeat protein